MHEPLDFSANVNGTNALPLLQFTLWQLLYGMALVALLLAVFGGEFTALIGIVFAAVVLLTLLVHIRDRAKNGGITPFLRPRDVLISLGGVVVLGLFFAPFVSWSQTFLRSERCWMNQKVISLGLANYHDAHRCYPPAFIADANGKPHHSWRVLLLPYVNESSLYSQYRLNEPWDSPHNRQLLKETPHVYCCSGDRQKARQEIPPGHTNYLAITGPETAFDKSTPFDGPIDELPYVVVAEVPDRTVPWIAPTDISAADYLAMHTPPRCCWTHSLNSNFFRERPGGCYGATRDGHQQFVSANLLSELRRDLITRGGTSYQEVIVGRGDGPSTGHWKRGNIGRLTTLLLMIFVPRVRGRNSPVKSNATIPMNVE